MWHRLWALHLADPGLASAAADLSKSTARQLILTISGAYLLWYLLLGGGLSSDLIVGFLPVTAILILAALLSERLLSRWFVLGLAVWQGGLLATITLALYVSQQPALALSFALVPLMATLTLGWSAGLAAEGLVAGLLWWIGHNSAMPLLPAGQALAIVVGAALASVLGWVVADSLLSVTVWSLFSFEQARQRVEEAREQRLELKQAQEDLVLANRELARLSDRLKVMYQVAEEARQAKAEFVANVSHELRTPLNMIIGFSDVITQSPEVYGQGLTSELLADITAIQRNSQHLARLVDDVLDLSQIEAGRMAISREWVSLQTTVEEAVQGVRPLFEVKQLYLQAEAPPGLPPVYCDGTRIRQVIINLLSNAGRFTEQGGVRVSVRVKEQEVVVAVTDTGPGILPVDREKLFEPFQQLDSSIRRRHGGSGLGLSISKRFVEMHGGKMWVESQPGVGTAVLFSLPLSQPALHADDQGDVRRWFNPYSEYEYRARTRRSRAPAPVSSPRYVLLDSAETLQRLFSRYLDTAETVVTGNLETAFAALSQSPAQALVVNAPPSGARAQASPGLLDRLPYGTPSVTCWVPGNEERAQQLGVTRYLIKPVTQDTLLSSLDELGDQVKLVLLVDDEQEVLRLFTRMLSAAGGRYRTLWATTGPQALDLLRRRRPDAMLLDLLMPGMDGFQVLQEKSRDASIRDIPVLIVSSLDPRGDPIVSDALTVTRSGGLSARDLLACIQAVSAALLPSAPPTGPGQPETPAG